MFDVGVCRSLNLTGTPQVSCGGLYELRQLLATAKSLGANAVVEHQHHHAQKGDADDKETPHSRETARVVPTHEQFNANHTHSGKEAVGRVVGEVASGTPRRADRTKKPAGGRP